MTDVAEMLQNMIDAYPEAVFPTPPEDRRPKDAAAAYVMREMAVPRFVEALAEIVRLREALSDSCDEGRHDAIREGRPWCPAEAEIVRLQEALDAAEFNRPLPGGDD